MPTAYINIGSNMGDRTALIESAVAHIEHLCGASARRAPIVESEPWGYESPNPYLNLGIAIDTDIDPLRLLRSLRQIERSISSKPHRNAKGEYIDRPIDIDLIAIDELTYDHPELTLPHPRMHLRRFVMEPMAFLAPNWHHPRLKASAAELFLALSRQS